MKEDIQTFVPAYNKRNLPRDVFLHLFSIVALYWVSIGFITLCWQYVNYFFPDVLNYSYGFSGSMRFALASLFILFPLFILVSWILNRIYTRESEVRDSKIRKWLIYLTLFLASLVIVGDLVLTVNTFLNGEITTRFVLKALSVLVVTAAIFGYYLDDVRRSAPSHSAKYWAFGTSAVVAIAVVSAFFIVGSPAQARLAQFDQQKVGDLQNIQYQVVNYWQRKGGLPKTLADMEDPLSGYMIPNDPQSDRPYEYVVKDSQNLVFELCAEFNLDGNQNRNMPKYAYPVGDLSQNWGHGAGRTCFERKVDKELYPPYPK